MGLIFVVPSTVKTVIFLAILLVIEKLEFNLFPRLLPWAFGVIRDKFLGAKKDVIDCFRPYII